MDAYPPNSRKAAEGDRVKRVQQVTTAEATRRKKPLGKKFRETFISGDGKTTLEYVITSVLIPAARDALADAGSQAIERLIYGESSGKRKSSPYGSVGHVAYNRMSQQAKEPAGRSISRQSRQKHDFDEIILDSRAEADDVIRQLFTVLSQFDLVSVADLYDLVGIKPEHTDGKWGWDDLQGATVRRVRNGYLLLLPEPTYLA